MVDRSVNFGAPPVQEVALGRTFLPRRDFLIPHFGAFWNEFRHRLPEVVHAPPIVDQNEGSVDSDALLPRVWFRSSDSTALLQMQQDRLHLNWRTTAAKCPYPGFPQVRSEFDGYWKLLSLYVEQATKAPLQPVTAELVYTNILEVEGGDASEIATQSLKDWGWARGPRFLGAPKAFSLNYNFDLPENAGVLHVSAVSARRNSDQAHVVKLELIARGKNVPDDAAFERWTVLAHDFLVAAFEDLTTKNMHLEWKQQPGDADG